MTILTFPKKIVKNSGLARNMFAILSGEPCWYIGCCDACGKIDSFRIPRSLEDAFFERVPIRGKKPHAVTECQNEREAVATAAVPEVTADTACQSKRV